tara:strand:- start:3425 stop:3628 length:204 start_codon:yes stop_codon:yes gene_type:complete
MITLWIKVKAISLAKFYRTQHYSTKSSHNKNIITPFYNQKKRVSNLIFTLILFQAKNQLSAAFTAKI